MKTPAENYPEDSDCDPLGRILAQDAKDYPVQVSPWFTTTTLAAVRHISQKTGFFSWIAPRIRWVVPIPIAGTALVALLALQHSSQSRSFSSSESEFEQHIEMFASSDYTQDNFFINQ